MGKDATGPADPATPPRGLTGRPSGAGKVKQGAGSQRVRNPLEGLAEGLGRSAAREMLRDLCMVPTTELLFVLALVYAFVVATLHSHAVHLTTTMIALPY